MADTIGIHRNVNFLGFPSIEKGIIEGRLKHEWLITRAEHRTIGNSDYRIVFSKPSKKYSDLFHLIREFIVFFSPYPEFQGRNVNAILSIIDRLQTNTRIDKTVVVVISKSKNLFSEIKDIISTQPELPILVPFIYNELQDEKIDVIARFKEYFFQRDLFSFRGELRTERYFYGRNDLAVRLAKKHLSHENSGLFGLRKAGKTSVLHAVKRHLSNEDTLIVLINCQNPAYNQLTWNSILYQIIQDVKLQNNLKCKVRAESYYESLKASESFYRDLTKLCKASGNKRILLIFDEIEHITYRVSSVEHWYNGNSFVPFWQTIRSLYQRNDTHVSFLIAGTNPLCVELPMVNGVDNPIFELVDKNAYIEPFSLADTQEMVSDIGGLMGIKFDELIFARLLEDFGGHPFLIRQFCSRLHQTIQEPRPFKIDRSYYKKVYEEHKGEVDTYINMIVGVLEQHFPEEYDLLRQLAAGNTDTFNEFVESNTITVSHLLGYGILEKSSECFDFRIESLKSYLQEKNKYIKSAPQLNLEEKWTEITIRRGKIEIELRGMFKQALISKFGLEGAKLWFIETCNKGKFRNRNIHDLFDPNICEIYLKDFVRMVNKDYDLFSNLIPNREQFVKAIETLNDTRAEAHGKDIDTDTFLLFRSKATRLEKLIEEITGKKIH